MESDENNVVIICISECFYQSSLSISDSFLLSPFPKQRKTMYYRVGGLLIGLRREFRRKLIVYLVSLFTAPESSF